MITLTALAILAILDKCISLKSPERSNLLDNGDDIFQFARGLSNSTLPLHSIDLDGIVFEHKGIHHDIRLNGEPKSGTTWLGEIIKRILVHTCDHNNLCKVKTKTDRFLSLETLGGIINFNDKKGKHVIPEIGHHESIDYSKPPTLSDDEVERRAQKYFKKMAQDKIIFAVFRDPRSVAISTCFHKIKDCPNQVKFVLQHIRYLSKWISLRHRFWTAIQKLDTKKVKLLFYEDLRQDIRTMIREIAEFLGMSISPEMITKVRQETELESMRGNETVPEGGAKSGKVREGKVCNYRENMPPRAAELITKAMYDELSPELYSKWYC